ncbi:MAG: hypothetical protein PVH88_27105 [Ignavibacteria bacterium]|jgi:hypothetical protein
MVGKDELAKKIRIFLEDLGIDPFYAVTVFCILISLSYWNHYKNWKTIEGWRKGLAGSALFATLILSMISILRLLGVINL